MRSDIRLCWGDKLLIERESYLNRLKAVKDVPDIKVITGIRRSGKSKLMDAFIDYIKEDSNANVVRIKLNLNYSRLNYKAA